MEYEEKKSLNTKRIVEDFYLALNAREFNTVAGKFADKIDWDIPGEASLAPWLGIRTRRYEVIDFFELLLQNIEPLSFNIEHLLVEGNFAVATGQFVSKMLATGTEYNSPFSAHFTIKDDFIIRYRFLEDSNGLVKALKEN